jgi:hypothetical protein
MLVGGAGLSTPRLTNCLGLSCRRRTLGHAQHLQNASDFGDERTTKAGGHWIGCGNKQRDFRLRVARDEFREMILNVLVNKGGPKSFFVAMGAAVIVAITLWAWLRRADPTQGDMNDLAFSAAAGDTNALAALNRLGPATVPRLEELCRYNDLWRSLGWVWRPSCPKRWDKSGGQGSAVARRKHASRCHQSSRHDAQQGEAHDSNSTDDVA